MAVIKPLREKIMICPECEAFWSYVAPICLEAFRDFGIYIETKGYQWDWKLLDVDGAPNCQ